MLDVSELSLAGPVIKTLEFMFTAIGGRLMGERKKLTASKAKAALLRRHLLHLCSLRVRELAWVRVHCDWHHIVHVLESGVAQQGKPLYTT